MVAEQMSAVIMEIGTFSEEMWDSWLSFAGVLGFVERRSTVMEVGDRDSRLERRGCEARDWRTERPSWPAPRTRMEGQSVIVKAQKSMIICNGSMGWPLACPFPLCTRTVSRLLTTTRQVRQS